MEEELEQWDYKILVNNEGQYSLWPAFKTIPLGWEQAGPVADKPTCLTWIAENWTDMRPRSLRGFSTHL
jgi:MbtH protein